MAEALAGPVTPVSTGEIWSLPARSSATVGPGRKRTYTQVPQAARLGPGPLGGEAEAGLGTEWGPFHPELWAAAGWQGHCGWVLAGSEGPGACGLVRRLSFAKHPLLPLAHNFHSFHFPAGALSLAESTGSGTRGARPAVSGACVGTVALSPRAPGWPRPDGR